MTSSRKRIINDWETSGYKFFEENIWSSALQISDLEKLRHFLLKNRFSNVDVALARPIGDDGRRIQWVRYYDITGQCLVADRETRIPQDSNNLKLTFAYQSAKERELNWSRKVVAANAIRLVFGVSAARELILTSNFSIETPEEGPSSDIGYASLFDTQNVNRFANPPIEDAEISHFPIEAASLLDKAFSQIYPEERFVLMWLAYESIISAFPGREANGIKRKRFFKSVLGSELINEESIRLHKLRNSLFKEGKIDSNNIDSESFKLYSIIQLSMMGDCPQRASFVKGFELSLLERGRL